MTDVSTLLVCLTVGLLWWRAESRIDQVLQHVIRPAPASEPTPEIPLDIEQRALQWQDGHAQESYRARAREIYAESSGPQDIRWERVRNILALEAES